MAWYKSFFHGLPQQAWKDAQTEEQTELEADFLYDVLELDNDLRVLDIFCGYGRHALDLANRGCHVTGVDISTEYIDELRKEARQTGLSIEAIAGDFLTAPLEGPYDAAYCFGNSLSFFPHDQMLAFLQKIAENLKPGGLFADDTGMIAESVLPDFQERGWMQIGAITLLMENEYNVQDSCVDSHLTYLHNGNTEQRMAKHYLFTIAHLRALFAQAGLTITEMYSDLEGSDFRLGDERLLLLARKA